MGIYSIVLLYYIVGFRYGFQYFDSTPFFTDFGKDSDPA